MISFIDNLINNLLSPSYCISCRIFINNYNTVYNDIINDITTMLCNKCLNKIQRITVYNININRDNKEFNLPVYSAGLYKYSLGSIVKANSKSHYYVNKLLASLIWNYSGISKINFDYIIPVPLCWSEFASIGYNKSYAIAKELSRISNKPIIRLVKRLKYTKSQALLSYIYKSNKVVDNFIINKKYIKDKDKYKGSIFLLVDDLCKTGDTLKNIALEINKLKPDSLIACTAARALK